MPGEGWRLEARRRRFRGRTSRGTARLAAPRVDGAASQACQRSTI